MTSKKKFVAWTVAVVCVTLLLEGLAHFFIRVPAVFHVSILGRTNDSLGGSKVLVRVANNTPRIQNFTFWAEIQTAGGWAEATNWEFQHPGRLHWIEGHDTNEFALSPPAGVKIWRLKYMQEPQPSTLELKWSAAAKWAGLKRFGLREQPEQSYYFTDRMTN